MASIRQTRLMPFCLLVLFPTSKLETSVTNRWTVLGWKYNVLFVVCLLFRAYHLSSARAANMSTSLVWWVDVFGTSSSLCCGGRCSEFPSWL